MGLSLDMGLGGSVFGQGYPGAATPAAAGAALGLWMWKRRLFAR